MLRVQFLIEPISNRSLIFLVNIDETHLTYTHRLICHTSWSSQFYWNHPLALITSTNSLMANFTPFKKFDSSFRADDLAVLVSPILYHQTLGVLAKHFRNLEHQAVISDNVAEYVYGWKRVGYILSCGRPLFIQLSRSLWTKFNRTVNLKMMVSHTGLLKQGSSFLNTFCYIHILLHNSTNRVKAYRVL